MRVVQLNSVALRGDAISSVIRTNNKIDRQHGGADSKTVVELFSEMSEVLTMAYKDYYDRQSIRTRLTIFMRLGNKTHWLKLYFKSLKQYKPQAGRKAIENADIRIWHYGGPYQLIHQFHDGDVLFYHGITYPYLVGIPEVSYKGYTALPTLRSLSPTVVVTSEFTKSDLIKQGFDPGAIRVLPLFHTYNLKYANTRSDRVRVKKPQLLAYGRYAKNKAVPELAKICNEAGIGLTHFGENKMMKEFRKEYMSARKYANDNIRILPKQVAIENFFEDSDIYVCNSYHEGFNMPTIESMAHSLPVLVRRDTAMGDLITEGREGYLFDNADEIPNLAYKIMKNYKSFSLNAWKRSHDYNLDNYKIKYLKILKETSAKRSR
jgi:glycosyltransferase involved in cell wall biosynthesis